MPAATIVIKVAPSLSFSVHEQTKLAKMFQVFAKRHCCCPTDVVVAVWNDGDVYASAFTTDDNDTTVDAAGISTVSHVKVFQRKDLVGRRVRKFFQGHGYFDGTVTNVNGPWMRVKYTDGDREDMYTTELFEHMVRTIMARAAYTRQNTKMEHGHGVRPE